ncbi:hypothetical protein BV20DRAFT_165547 [Pilatotrama ljubarskyi]|nr:hypothetical protein BV20DRAFT_165547 [Pilatotrama ljubarskyi]
MTGSPHVRRGTKDRSSTSVYPTRTSRPTPCGSKGERTKHSSRYASRIGVHRGLHRDPTRPSPSRAKARAQHSPPLTRTLAQSSELSRPPVAPLVLEPRRFVLLTRRLTTGDEKSDPRCCTVPPGLLTRTADAPTSGHRSVASCGPSARICTQCARSPIRARVATQRTFARASHRCPGLIFA